ncbi:hypothetical protein D3C72_1872930 [compost metagenome]
MRLPGEKIPNNLEDPICTRMETVCYILLGKCQLNELHSARAVRNVPATDSCHSAKYHQMPGIAKALSLRMGSFRFPDWLQHE